MKHLFPFLLLSTLLATSCSLLKKKPEPATNPNYSTRAGADRNQVYVDKFSPAAILEMQRLGVPASITLAQGILESGAGTSELAQNANNHFGIKCGNDWTGPTFMKKDDDKDASGKIKESCFRKYSKVEESYIDHAQFLRDPKKATRYGFLFELDRTDYKAWAKGLESAGYSTSNTYAEKLIDLIDRYKLHEYDLPGKSTSVLTEPEKPQYGTETQADIALPTAENRVGKINNVKVVVTREGESVKDIAQAYRLDANKVAEYNDRGYTPIQKLKANTRVFIEPKKDKWEASSASDHVAKSNQTMFEISQLYGVKLNKLLERNNLSLGQEPAEDERILLKGTRSKSDKVHLRDNLATTDDSPTANPNGYGIAPQPKTMEPDDEGLLDEISGGEQDKKEQPKPPSATTTPPPVITNPSNTQKPPVVTSGTNYPPATNTTSQPTPAPSTSNTHVVAKGDTLTNIANRYSTTVQKLRQLNNLQNDSIQIGQRLRVK